MNDILKQAQKMQKDMEDAQKQLESNEIEVSSGGGAVVFKITGSTKFTGVTLSEELLKEDKATVEQMILEGAKEAVKAAKKAHEEVMLKITEGLKLPDIPGMPGMGGPQPRAFKDKA